MIYKILFSKCSLKDAVKIKKCNLSTECQSLLNLIAKDPYVRAPSYEKLLGDLKGYYSRRINIQRRLIYQVNDEEKS